MILHTYGTRGRTSIRRSLNFEKIVNVTLIGKLCNFPIKVTFVNFLINFQKLEKILIIAIQGIKNSYIIVITIFNNMISLEIYTCDFFLHTHGKRGRTSTRSSLNFKETTKVTLIGKLCNVPIKITFFKILIIFQKLEFF